MENKDNITYFSKLLNLVLFHNYIVKGNNVYGGVPQISLLENLYLHQYESRFNSRCYSLCRYLNDSIVIQSNNNIPNIDKYQ